jgi:predicted RNase H-like nuclease (RuvC/YqgF family)
MKRLTREQIQGRKEKAVRFVSDVLGDPERAEEIERESLEDYAARRKIQLMNPERRGTMPRKTIEDYRAENADLKAEIGELEEENENLQEQLDSISDIVAGEEEEEEDDDEPGE